MKVYKAMFYYTNGEKKILLLVKEGPDIHIQIKVTVQCICDIGIN